MSYHHACNSSECQSIMSNHCSECEWSVNVKSDFDVRTLASDVVAVVEIDDRR